MELESGFIAIDEPVESERRKNPPPPPPPPPSLPLPPPDNNDGDNDDKNKLLNRTENTITTKTLTHEQTKGLKIRMKTQYISSIEL